MQKNVDQFYECAALCDIDYLCLNDCTLELGVMNKLCPCGEKCPRESYF